MQVHNSQSDPQIQPAINLPFSQTQSHKNPTHFTIQQQNQNHKQLTKPQRTKSRLLHKKAQQKNKHKISKQTRRVKSLEEEYRDLQQELREIKELVQIQVEMIGYGVQEINEKSRESFREFQTENSPANKPSNFRLNIGLLQSCLQQLFTYHTAIQTANSNYLLLSQVNKQEQSQQVFHIHNLEQRIRQLRFLLNGKEDLLAYEIATFEGAQHVENGANDVRKIFIDYHLPRRESLANKNNLQAEFKFVEKVIAQMLRLRKTVSDLEQQQSKGNSKTNNIQNQETNHCQEKDSIKQNQENLPDDKSQNLATHIKTTRNRQIDRSKGFSECQNTLMAAQTSRPAQKSIFSISKQSPLPEQHQLTLLPLSIQNYRHSLIYRVGKLQAMEQQSTRKLKENYQNLSRLVKQEQLTRKKLVKEYELKRDVYEYKRKLIMGKQAHQVVVKSNTVCMDNVLGELEQERTLVMVMENVDIERSGSNVGQGKSNQEQTQQKDKIQKIPFQNETIELKISSSSKSLSVIHLNSSSQSQFKHSEPLSPQNHLLFKELTNSQTTPNKQPNNSPFLKLKTSKSKEKRPSFQDDLGTNTPMKQKNVCEYGDKENTSHKRNIEIKSLNHLKEQQNYEQQKVEQLGSINNNGTQSNRDKSLGPERIQQRAEIKKVKSTLRRRRQNTKINKKDDRVSQERPIPTDD